MWKTEIRNDFFPFLPPSLLPFLFFLFLFYFALFFGWLVGLGWGEAVYTDNVIYHDSGSLPMKFLLISSQEGKKVFPSYSCET